MRWPLDVDREKKRKLGLFVRQRRTSMKLSLTRLAETCGVDRSALGKFERDADEWIPVASQVDSMAEALHMSVTGLYAAAGLADPRLLDWLGEAPSLCAWLEAMRAAEFEDDDFERLHDAMVERGLLPGGDE